ncbi:MAG: MBL fold metallo-hydrolase [Bacteroidota bacterium]
MLDIQAFVFNPYQENTYVVSDETKSCVIIDPGCYRPEEKQLLVDYIEQNGLKPIYLLNTHGHIDHMLGNYFVKEKYQIPFLTHEIVVQELESVIGYAAAFGMNPDPSPAPDQLVGEGDIITFGQTSFEVMFTPGHSAGHISFFHRESQQLFSGDVLFQGSIGRTDLPGGDSQTLMQTIENRLLPLGDEVRVYTGHGGSTTIGRERVSNPFILQWLAHGYI